MNKESCSAIYLVRAVNGLVKIGTSSYPLRRFAQLQAMSPIPLEFVHFSVLANAVEVEASLHQEFASSRSHGEWFALTDDDLVSIVARFPTGDQPPPARERIEIHFPIGATVEIDRWAKKAGLSRGAYVERAVDASMARWE